MLPPDDAELLRRYALDRSEEAFALLVQRHIGAVYSVALRQVQGDTHLAEDITQIVFSTLARKGPNLAGRPVLGGWLYRTTRFAARDVIRAESRRRNREREALAMDEWSPGSGAAVDWEALRRVLDDIMMELKDADRAAVWLRFFEKRSFGEIGGQLQITENAARMRVDRALDRLHAALSRRGVRSTTAALAAALAHQPAVAVPAGLSVSIAAHAIAAAGANATTAGLVTLFTMSKIKMGMAGAIVLAVSVPLVVELRANRALRAQLAANGGGDITALRQENQRLATALVTRSETNPQLAEISRLRARAAVLKARPDGVLDSELKTAAAHRNAGRATPEAAHETLVWALLAKDLDTLASFVVFADDSPATRAAFMAQFSEAVRAKYRTPERLCAAALFGTDGQAARTPLQPGDAFQFLGTDDHVGGDGTRYGQIRLRVWERSVEGAEREITLRLQPTPAGYALSGLFLAGAPRPSDDASAVIRQRIDVGTGELLPPKP